MATHLRRVDEDEMTKQRAQRPWLHRLHPSRMTLLHPGKATIHVLHPATPRTAPRPKPQGTPVPWHLHPSWPKTYTPGGPDGPAAA